ncbi:MAG: hypothetical protein AAFP69_21620, partial [Planctomycetota bacterium]
TEFIDNQIGMLDRVSTVLEYAWRDRTDLEWQRDPLWENARHVSNFHPNSLQCIQAMSVAANSKSEREKFLIPD